MTSLDRDRTQLSWPGAGTTPVEDGGNTNVNVAPINDGAPASVLLLDAEGAIEALDVNAQGLLGYSTNELRGKSPTLLITSIDTEPPGCSSELQRVRLEPNARPLRVVLRARSGQTFPAELSLSEIELDSRTLFLGIVRDLRPSLAAHQTGEELLAIASHELRTPLTSIRGALALLSAGAAGPLSAVARDSVRIALRNSERLLRLVNDLLHLDRLEARAVPFRLQPVLVKPVLEQSLESTGELARSSSIALELSCPPDLWVTADAERLLQVINNLVSNAIKFSRTSGVVTLKGRVRDGTACISVEDRGVGIPTELRDRIFRRFAQAPFAARRGGGSGLGLSIAKSLVDNMGGSIHFESRAGGGTVFWVELPVGDARVQSEDEERPCLDSSTGR